MSISFTTLALEICEVALKIPADEVKNHPRIIAFSERYEVSKIPQPARNVLVEFFTSRLFVSETPVCKFATTLSEIITAFCSEVPVAERMKHFVVVFYIKQFTDKYGGVDRKHRKRGPISAKKRMLIMAAAAAIIDAPSDSD